MEATFPPQEAPAIAKPESGFLQRVFMWMFIGLLVTAGVAGAIRTTSC